MSSFLCTFFSTAKYVVLLRNPRVCPGPWSSSQALTNKPGSPGLSHTDGRPSRASGGADPGHVLGRSGPPARRPGKEWKPWHSIPKPQTQGPNGDQGHRSGEALRIKSSARMCHMVQPTPSPFRGKTEKSRPVKNREDPPPPLPHLLWTTRRTTAGADGTAELGQLRADIRKRKVG
jgi:hypothetical protein